jgi:hypothetical protein
MNQLDVSLTVHHSIDFISVTNLMYKFLFIHRILQPYTCFEQYCAHPQEVTLYTHSIRYRLSLSISGRGVRGVQKLSAQTVYRTNTMTAHRERRYHMLCVYNVTS